MTWFWHGHFAISVRKVRSAQLMYRRNDTFHTLGRGDFRSLAQAMLTDPAMLLWLEGAGSKAEHPNENLAREFMELFTLGLGNYTEDDVREAARALTGWRVDAATSTSRFVAAAHDPGPETLLSTTGSFDAGARRCRAAQARGAGPRPATDVLPPTVPCPAYPGPQCDSRAHERWVTGQDIVDHTNSPRAA